MKYIGLDIGTTTVCGILYDAEKHETLRIERRNNSYMEPYDPVMAAEDPSLIFSAVLSILDSLLAYSSDDVAGISLSCQMHGILYVEKEGNAVSPLYTWENKAGLGKEKELSSLLGYPVYSGYGIVTHHSIPHPDSAVKFCTIGDYVVMKLAGLLSPVTDYSLAASMGILDLSNMKVTDKVDASFFPAVVERPTVVGSRKGIPVVTAIGDNQASFLGTVRSLSGSLLLNYGTGGQISYFSDSADCPSSFERRPMGSEGFLNVAFSLAGGKAYSILADFYKSVLAAFGCTVPSDIYEKMDALHPSPEHGIAFSPLFLGKRGEEGRSASIAGITAGNFTAANVTDALIAGMAEELHEHYLEIPFSERERLTEIAGAGNGIRKNAGLLHRVEELYGKAVYFSMNEEESAVGAVINAMVALGHASSYSEAVSIINK